MHKGRVTIKGSKEDITKSFHCTNYKWGGESPVLRAFGISHIPTYWRLRTRNRTHNCNYCSTAYGQKTVFPCKGQITYHSCNSLRQFTAKRSLALPDSSLLTSILVSRYIFLPPPLGWTWWLLDFLWADSSPWTENQSSLHHCFYDMLSCLFQQAITQEPERNERGVMCWKCRGPSQLPCV